MNSHAAERAVVYTAGFLALVAAYILLDEITGCFRCGHPAGSSIHLCPSCIAELAWEVSKLPR